MSAIEPLFNQREMCERLAVSKATLAKLIVMGMPVIKLPFTRCVRFEREAVEQWLHEFSGAPAPSGKYEIPLDSLSRLCQFIGFAAQCEIHATEHFLTFEIRNEFFTNPIHCLLEGYRLRWCYLKAYCPLSFKVSYFSDTCGSFHF